MKSRNLSVLILATILLLFACSSERSNDTSPYVDMIELHTFDQLSNQFNHDNTRTRVIALMSPGDPLSQRVFEDLKDIFAGIDGDDLRLYAVWLPILEDDSRDKALELAGSFDDKRVISIWDSEGVSSRQWQLALRIDQQAWDVYMIYDKGHRWISAPESPDFCMRQLSGLTDIPFWNRRVFESKLREVVAENGAEQNEDEG